MRLNAKVFVVLVGLLAGLTIGVNAVMAGNTVGAFEIDGNTPDDSGPGDPIDWGSTPPPPNLTTFTDDTGDTQFAGGSKWNDQSTWGGCPDTGSVQAKSNIVNGAISFRTIGGQQFVYVNFTRVGNTGSANIDYEFNQGATPSPCAALPQRTVGDLVIAFDQDGNDPANVSLLRWNGTGFTELTSETIGNNWDGAVSGDRRFGEAALNLSALLGSPIECGDFASVHMDSRSAPQANSNMSDRTLTKPLNFANCPNSALKKEVRNVTTSGSFAESANASPGDTIEYKFTYTNTGSGQATGVVVTDEVPSGTSFVAGSGTGGCSESGGTVTCSFGTVAGGGSASGTFQVKLPATFPEATNTITNVGSVKSDTEAPKDSNTATVNVTAAPSSELVKTAKNDTTGGAAAKDITASPGDQVTYTFTYTNKGTSPAHNVTITDTVPTGTTFVSGSGCANNAGTVTCSLGTVNPNDPKTVSFTVKLDSSFPQGETVITNTGKVKTDEEPEKPSNPSTVTVTAAANVSLTKSTTTQPPVRTGDQITYKLAFANSGDADATNQVITEPIPEGTKFISCTGGCTTSGDPATSASWNIGTIAANGGSGSVTITVEVLPEAGDEVCNTATIGDPQAAAGVSSNQVCLDRIFDPDLTLVKSASQPSVNAGDQIEYTLTYGNNGDEATGVTITEPIPAGTTFVSCDPTCTQTGTPVSSVSWNVGTVGAEGGTVKLVVRTTNAVDCSVCNTATIASPDQDDGTPVSSNQVCTPVTPAPNPAGAHANGEAFGVHISDATLGLNINHGKVVSSQSGVGADSNSNSLITLAIPQPTGSLVSAKILSTTSTSTVTPTPAEATNTSTSEVADINLVSGLVRARTARAVAMAKATGTSSGVSSAGTTFSDLIVNGQRLNQVAPNTKIGLPKALFGAGSYVALREEIGSTTRPPQSQLSGGTYAADLEVNLIRVKITDLLPLVPGKQPTEIIVGHAKAHADFPQLRICADRAQQSVSGHAYVAAEATNPDLLPAIVGFAAIGDQGGDSGNTLDTLTLPGDGSVVRADVVETRVHGEILPGVSRANSHAQIANLCILRTALGTCTVGATGVRSEATSQAVPGAAASTDAGTTLLTLQIGGIPIPVNAPRNTIIQLDGLGFIALNQQFCDGGGAVPTCAGTAHSGLTERAIVLIVTIPNNPFGLSPGAGIVIGEAHSDATYIP